MCVCTFCSWPLVSFCLISIATLAFFWLPLAWNNFIHPPHFHCVSVDLNEVSYRQHICTGLIVSIQPLYVFWLERLVHLHLRLLSTWYPYCHFVNCWGVLYVFFSLLFSWFDDLKCCLVFLFVCALWMFNFVVPMRFLYSNLYIIAVPKWLSSKEPACQGQRHKRPRFDPWVRKTPWRRKWQPPPVFLPGESHGQRSLVGYSSWDPKESDMTLLYSDLFIIYVHDCFELLVSLFQMHCTFLPSVTVFGMFYIVILCIP